MTTVIRALLFLIGLGILVWLVIELDGAQVLQLIGQTGWRFGLVLAVYAGCQLTRAAALWLCQPQSTRLAYRHVLGARVSAEAVRLLTFTGPVLAEPSKVWLLRKQGLSAKEAIAAITAEIVIHSLVAAVLSIVALVTLTIVFDVSPTLTPLVYGLIGAMGVYVVGAVVAIGFRVYLIGAVVGGLARIGVLPFARDPVEVRQMEDLLLGVLRGHTRRLLAIVSWEAAANVLLIAEVWVALHAMGFDILPLTAMVIEGSVKLVSVVFFFIPTQIGAAEGTYAGLFGIVGLTAASGLAVALIRRVRTLIVAGIGLVALTHISSDRARPAAG